jgi:hypothetical protein
MLLRLLVLMMLLPLQPQQLLLLLLPMLLHPCLESSLPPSLHQRSRLSAAAHPQHPAAAAAPVAATACGYLQQQQLPNWHHPAATHLHCTAAAVAMVAAVPVAAAAPGCLQLLLQPHQHPLPHAAAHQCQAVPIPLPVHQPLQHVQRAQDALLLPA